MMISVRLDDRLENRLRQVAKQIGKSRSDIIKESVSRYLRDFSASPSTPYGLGKDLFGKYSSGKGGLSTLSSRELGKKIREKNIR